MKKISIAVGGTGIRSLSLIGILDAFKDENIKIDKIYSVGMATIISSMVYSGIYVFSIVNLMRKISIFRTNMLLNFEHKKESYKDTFAAYLKRYKFCSKNLVAGELKSNLSLESKLDEYDFKFFDNIKTLLIDIDSFKVKYCPVLSKKHLVASLSYGGLFEPEIIKGKRLVSGIDISEIPIIMDKPQDETIIAYDASSSQLKTNFNSIVGILARADEVRSQRIFKLYKKNYDHIVSLNIAKNSYWNEIESIPQVIEEGYEITKSFIRESLK